MTKRQRIDAAIDHLAVAASLYNRNDASTHLAIALNSLTPKDTVGGLIIIEDHWPGKTERQRLNARRRFRVAMVRAAWWLTSDTRAEVGHALAIMRAHWNAHAPKEYRFNLREPMSAVLARNGWTPKAKAS